MRLLTGFLVAMCILAAPGMLIYAEEVGEPFTIVFSTNEDYDTSAYATSEGLRDVEEDFKLVKELGLDKLRVSFSWSNYEPQRGNFANVDWLHQFVDLATEYEIELLPYFCYAPGWATPYGDWNEPPADLGDWYNYIYYMVNELKDSINTWEIWNEQDLDMWFTGTPDQFAEVLVTGSQAVRDADPSATVLMGGITQPNTQYVEYFLDKGVSDSFDVLPIHSYHESWHASAVESYLTNWGSPFEDIAELLELKGDGQAIWVNEIGYPTLGEKTELDQARFIRRAIATLMSTEVVDLISWYEIKDLPRDFHLGVIGDEINYHLGLTTTDRTRKLGFYTYQNIVELLNYETVTYLGEQIDFTENNPGRLPARVYTHGFAREERDDIILFAWLYGPSRESEVTLTLPGEIESVVEYDYDGSELEVTEFAGDSLELDLIQDHARLFQIKLAK